MSISGGVSAGTIAVFALVAGCGPSWTTVRTKTFNMYADGLVDAQPTLEALECANAGLRASFFVGVEIAPVDVLLLTENRFGEIFGRFRSGAALARTPEAEFGARGAVVLYADPNLERAGARPPLGAMEVAANEMVAHLFIEKVAPQAPLWFRDGMASFARNLTCVGENQTMNACMGYTPWRTTLPRRNVYSLAELFAAGWNEYDQTFGFDFRHSSRSLFDFLLMADSGARRPRFGFFMGAVAGGADGGAALAVLFPEKPIPQIELEYRDHAERIKREQESTTRPRGACPVGFTIPPALAPQFAAEVAAAPPERVQAILTALQRVTNGDGYAHFFPRERIERLQNAP